jgi:hypothetical protein
MSANRMSGGQVTEQEKAMRLQKDHAMQVMCSRGVGRAEAEGREEGGRGEWRVLGSNPKNPKP